MVCVEASLVVYLRTLHYPDNLLAIFPLRLPFSMHLIVVRAGFGGDDCRVHRHAAR